jgi:hypothetical protein
MKINKQIAVTSLTALLSLMMTNGGVAGACHDYPTANPNQSPSCSSGGENDNNCTEIDYNPSYNINATSNHRTGQTFIGAGPGSVSVVITTKTYQCYYTLVFGLRG